MCGTICRPQSPYCPSRLPRLNMTALQPLLAIVTLLLCFCGTLAAPVAVESHDVVVVKGKTQTQLPSAPAEDLLKKVDWRQVGNAAKAWGKDQLTNTLNKKKTKEELEIELNTLILKLETSFNNAKNLLDNIASMSAEELATKLKTIKDTLRPAVGGDNQIVVGVKQAKDNLQSTVKDPSSIKDNKVVQAVTSKPITDEVINLLVNTPSMSVEELAKHLKTIKDNLQGIVKDNKVVQAVTNHPITDEVVNHPITQKITETALPWLERWFKKGPAKIVM